MASNTSSTISTVQASELYSWWKALVSTIFSMPLALGPPYSLTPAKHFVFVHTSLFWLWRKNRMHVAYTIYQEKKIWQVLNLTKINWNTFILNNPLPYFHENGFNFLSCFCYKSFISLDLNNPQYLLHMIFLWKTCFKIKHSLCSFELTSTISKTNINLCFVITFSSLNMHILLLIHCTSISWYDLIYIHLHNKINITKSLLIPWRELLKIPK